MREDPNTAEMGGVLCVRVKSWALFLSWEAEWLFLFIVEVPTELDTQSWHPDHNAMSPFLPWWCDIVASPFNLCIGFIYNISYV